MRLVSLVPSLTELVCELGLTEHLVGRTGYCIHPADQVKDIAKVGGTKTVNLKKVRALQPTHLIVNVDENEKPTIDALRDDVGEVVVTHPQSVDDNRALILEFGQKFACEEQAAAWVKRFDDERAQLYDWVAMRGAGPKRVLYLIWQDPWMTVGPQTFISAMLREAGMHTWSPADATARYPEIDMDQVPWAQIDAVLLSTEPFNFLPQHVAEMQVRSRCPSLLIDGEMTSWYGTRVVQGFSYLRNFREQMR